MARKVLIAVPPVMLEKLDHIAAHEQRTRSELFRESLRRYIDNFEDKRGEVKTKYDGELQVD